MFKGFSYSVQGASHVSRGLVCQDASAYVVKDRYAAAVAADGHGSKSRTPDMARAYAQVAKVKGESYANRIFIGNPSKIVG